MGNSDHGTTHTYTLLVPQTPSPYAQVGLTVVRANKESEARSHLALLPGRHTVPLLPRHFGVIKQSVSLKYEPASEPLHNYVKLCTPTRNPEPGDRALSLLE